FIADKWDEKCSLYAISTIRKAAGDGWSYAVKFNRTLVRELMIELPVIENSNPDHEYTVDDIDWQYMRDRITELERDRITELDAYLQATGLNDYELTEDDKEILSLFAKRASDENGTLEDIGEDEVRFGEFVLGGDDGLFNIYSPKKRFNANTITFGGKYPYVARGSSNNGIRGYITEDEKYLSPAKSLSFGQDTATVYYQPDAYFTGDKIKVMVLNNRELTPELAEYFIAAIARAFSTFAWGQSSFNENIIKSMKIELPIKSDGTPDFDYMERYIRAMEKVVIADVVKYKDKVIETTKKVVGD
ncbi:MAG: restriction endonuclease subunit S, partial [Clostridium sp.]|nr:restriction endonuclease subunit S [Clostridium sp.]